jgi:hypothetical protein
VALVVGEEAEVGEPVQILPGRLGITIGLIGEGARGRRIFIGQSIDDRCLDLPVPFGELVRIEEEDAPFDASIDCRSDAHLDRIEVHM